jgi:glycosyltransferase involved in cell wall biosynthesis
LILRYNEPLTNVLIADKHKTKTKIKPALSVVVPVFQEEKILEEHLSVFTETLRKKYKFELIVSDGGSTDKTLEIARKYADKVVEHTEERRQTISEGRNNGANAAEGDTIVFINADTFPKNINNFFEIITAWNEKQKKFDAMACYVWAFPDEIILKDKIFYILHNSYVNFLNKIGIGMGRGECQIVRKKSFEEVGGYNSLIVAGEDFDLYRRLAHKGKINFSKELVVYESPRRFRKYGYIKTVTYWMLNSLSVMFFGKSVSKEWEAVR